MTKTVCPHNPTEPVELLLVEDDEEVIARTREAFATAGIETSLRTAETAQKAYEILTDRLDRRRSAPVLVLVDLDLSEADGLEVVEAIRSDRDLSTLPVLVFSDDASPSDVQVGYERAANAFLEKPTTREEFHILARTIASFWFETVTLPPLSR